MGEVQGKAPKIKDLLKVIKTQQDQITAQQERMAVLQTDITAVKEKHNEMVGFLGDLAKTLEKGGGTGRGGDLSSIATIIGALARAGILGGGSRESALFQKLGIWTVKRAFLGKIKLDEKAVKEIAETMGEKAKEEE